jgi:glyoxalase family protein
MAGIHHVTAISGGASRNVDFYTRTLGMRLVKKTVNFDDPGTYHLYYGDEQGKPGTVLTFFPWSMPRRAETATARRKKRRSAFRLNRSGTGRTASSKRACRTRRLKSGLANRCSPSPIRTA